ncbi:pectate lyase, partial [Streptomyces solisilvae]
GGGGRALVAERRAGGGSAGAASVLAGQVSAGLRAAERSGSRPRGGAAHRHSPAPFRGATEP